MSVNLLFGIGPKGLVRCVFIKGEGHPPPTPPSPDMTYILVQIEAWFIDLIGAPLKCHQCLMRQGQSLLNELLMKG